MILKRYNNILLLLLSFVVAFAAAECSLRLAGYQPGFKAYPVDLKEVDPLYILDGYYTDSNGIMKISQNAREFICKELRTKKSRNELTPISPRQAKEVYKIADHFMQLKETEFTSSFKTFIETLHSSADSLEKEFIEAVRSYVICPINSDGFRSIEFKKYTIKRKSILLLGDSFTWGHSAQNSTNSFADLLLAKGYVVYNTGIIGADPAQYLQIAKVLIPKLQPDYVVVNFYMGNDVYYFERKPEPYVPVFYSTNAGNIISHPEGSYIYNAEEAYKYALQVLKIPGEHSRFNRLCSKTVITSLCWSAAKKVHLVDSDSAVYNNTAGKSKVQYYPKPYSNVQLLEIKEITERFGTFILVAIPQLNKGKLIMPQDVPGLFDGIEFFVPPVTVQDFRQRSDGHYLDHGHAIHALFIDSLCSIIGSRRFKGI